MIDRSPLALAKARNYQRTKGKLLQSKLQAVFKNNAPSEFVNPELSLEVADLLDKAQQLFVGEFIRQSDLTHAGTQFIVHHVTDCLGDPLVYIILANHPACVFPLPLELFGRHVDDILDIDGDTVAAVSRDLTAGISIDLYFLENESRVYEVDVWGSWKHHMQP